MEHVIHLLVFMGLFCNVYTHFSLPFSYGIFIWIKPRLKKEKQTSYSMCCKTDLIQRTDSNYYSQIFVIHVLSSGKT